MQDLWVPIVLHRWEYKSDLYGLLDTDVTLEGMSIEPFDDVDDMAFAGRPTGLSITCEPTVADKRTLLFAISNDFTASNSSSDGASKLELTGP